MVLAGVTTATHHLNSASVAIIVLAVLLIDCSAHLQRSAQRLVRHLVLRGRHASPARTYLLKEAARRIAIVRRVPLDNIRVSEIRHNANKFAHVTPAATWW